MPEAGARGPLPAFFELDAPPAWRAIDLFSDLHLCEALPRTFDAFVGHLNGSTADALFILGDLFEVWVGDDMAGRGFERQCVQALAEAARRRPVAFMVGNRDFLAGADVLRQCGAMSLPDPTLLKAWGQRIVLSHGDALCLADEPYQAFRRMVRSKEWQATFLSRPLVERLKIAADIRHASQSRHQFDGAIDADVDTAEALRWLQAAGAQVMVHGHTHRPGSHTLAPGFKRHVLSDWDLDLASRADVIRLTRDGFERLPPTPA